MRVIFAGTASFALPSLKALIDASYEVVGVLTQPDRPRGRGLHLGYSSVKEIALENNLSVLQPESLKDEKTKREILNLKPDLVVVAAYGKILPEWMFEEIKYGAINIHASLLPKYRGAAPIERAITDGEKETGISIIQMDEGLDTGDILLKRSVPVGSEETAGELSEKLANLSVGIVKEVMTQIEQGRLARAKQTGRATYAEKVTKEEAEINWSWSAEKIHNLIRALNPHPGAYASYKDMRVKMWRSRLGSGGKMSTAPAGTITDINDEGFTVSCGESAIVVMEVQPENKKKMTAAEFSRGYRLQVGEILK